MEILKAKSQNDIGKLTHDMKATLDPKLKNYFEKEIEPKIEKFACPYVSKYTKFDKFSSVTTNQSEGKSIESNIKQANWDKPVGGCDQGSALA